MIDRSGSVGFQDFSEITFQEIAQGQIPIMIQTAGDNRAVTKHTDLITQTVTKDLFSLILRL